MDDERHPGAATALLVAGALAALGCGLLFVWLATEVAEGDVQAFDEAVLLWLHRHRHAALTSTFLTLTSLGSTKVLVLLLIGIVPALWLSGRPGMATALVTAMLGASLISRACKAIFERARPEVVDQLDRVHGYSFPSGHTLGSVVFFTTIALLIGSHARSGILRTFLVLYAALVGALVALSRMYLGVHYPSDVLAGGLVGVAWSFTVVLAEGRWRHARHRQVRRTPQMG
jgi:undecaprenyl-diphosphatase